MKRLQQFAGLPARERKLLLRGLIAVAAARIALWTIPFRWVCLAAGRRRTVSPELAALRVKRLAWAVQAAARRIPGASCLTQALVLQYLMARAGRDADVHIGVAKDATGGFEAHAWVEYRGEILVGGAEAERYAPILAMRVRER